MENVHAILDNMYLQNKFVRHVWLKTVWAANKVQMEPAKNVPTHKISQMKKENVLSAMYKTVSIVSKQIQKNAKSVIQLSFNHHLDHVHAAKAIKPIMKGFAKSALSRIA